MSDSADVLAEVDAAHPAALVQLQLLHALGQSNVNIVRGQTDQLKVMTKDDMLNRFFTDDLGCVRVNYFLADAVHQITSQCSWSNVLEIGGDAGAGYLL